MRPRHVSCDPKVVEHRAALVEEAAREVAKVVAKAIRKEAKAGSIPPLADLGGIAKLREHLDLDEYLNGSVEAPALLWWRENELGDAVVALLEAELWPRADQ